MSQIRGLPVFSFPGSQYLPDIITLPDKVLDFDYESMSKWLHGGLSATEMKAQAGVILSSPVVRTVIDTENYAGDIVKAKFSDDFSLKIYKHLQKAARDEVGVLGDDWYTLSFIIQGSYRGRVEETPFHYRAGACVLVHYEAQTYSSELPVLDEPGIVVDVQFRPQVLARKLGISRAALSRILRRQNTMSPSPYHTSCLATPKMADSVNELLSGTMDVTTFKLFAEGKALELLTHFLLTLEEQDEQWGANRLPSAILLHSAKTLLTQNYLDPPGIDELCRAVGLSRSALTQGFKSRFGETVCEYVQRQRMEKARQLLADSQFSIEQVAELVGYRDPGSFRKIFQRHFGMLPRNYKAKLFSAG